MPSCGSFFWVCFKECEDETKNDSKKKVTLKDIAAKTGLSVIASGGIASLNDLLRLKEAGLYGAILGRSIYTGAVNLKEAIHACK